MFTTQQTVTALSSATTSRLLLDLERYVGNYTDGASIMLISLHDRALRLKQWGGDPATYTITPSCRTFATWPAYLFALATVVSDAQPPQTSNARGNITGGKHISFSLAKQSPDSVAGFLWQKPGSLQPRRFVKRSYNTDSPLLSMPPEILNQIVKLTLTADTFRHGVVHLHEQADHVVFAETQVMPAGGLQLRWQGNKNNLPTSFNQLQYVCRDVSSRGLVVWSSSSTTSDAMVGTLIPFGGLSDNPTCVPCSFTSAESPSPETSLWILSLTKTCCTG